jgi:hypothetical protein
VGLANYFLYKLDAVQYYSGELTLLEPFLFWLLEICVLIKSYMKPRQRMGSSGGDDDDDDDVIVNNTSTNYDDDDMAN